MPARESAILALTGFGIWLSGAIGFRFIGHLLFESGLAILAVSAVGVAFSVCMMLGAVMGWRKIDAAQAVPVAVTMAIPGLFADSIYVLAFHQATGLDPLTGVPFAAVVLFGNASLLAYALFMAARAKAR